MRYSRCVRLARTTALLPIPLPGGLNTDYHGALIMDGRFYSHHHLRLASILKPRATWQVPESHSERLDAQTDCTRLGLG
jgi:hypothetical protein